MAWHSMAQPFHGTAQHEASLRAPAAGVPPSQAEGLGPAGRCLAGQGGTGSPTAPVGQPPGPCGQGRPGRASLGRGEAAVGREVEHGRSCKARRVVQGLTEAQCRVRVPAARSTATLRHGSFCRAARAGPRAGVMPEHAAPSYLQRCGGT